MLDRLLKPDTTLQNAAQSKKFVADKRSIGKQVVVNSFYVPEKSLTKQYAALVSADGASLDFTEDGIREIARLAAQVNERMENIGARRLHTVMTTLLEEVLYDLPDGTIGRIVVDPAMVRERLKSIAEDEDLRKYIL